VQKKEKGERMLKGKSKILSALLTAVLLLGIFPVYAGFPTEPHPGNAVWMEPSLLNFTSDVMAPPNNKFRITVWVNFTSITAGDYIGAYGWVIVYNKNLLKFSAWDMTARLPPDHPVRPNAKISEWFKSVGMWKVEIKFSMGAWDADHDYVMPGESWLEKDIGEPDNPKAPEGSYGSTCWIEFEIISYPGKFQKIEDLIFFDTADPPPKSKLLNEAGADVGGEFTWYNATYKLWWAPPTVNPYLAIDPTSREYGPYPPRINCTTSFTEDIYIKELDIGWALTNATFTLSYNATLLSVIDILLNTTAFDVAATADNTTTPGKIYFVLKTSKSLSGNIKAATVTFHIIYQGDHPAVDVSPLAFTEKKLMDHEGEIPTRPSVNGTITIKGVSILPSPWLEVKFSPENSITFGPEPVIGKEFNATIWIRNLHFAWYLIGIQYRLSYCPKMLNVTRVREGPYMPSFNQTVDPPYTWFTAILERDSMWGPHILVGELILPNGTGQWPAPLPGAVPPEDGLIATITFKIIDQKCDENLTCALKFLDTKLIDIRGAIILEAPSVNGTVTVLSTSVSPPGRVIDVYGGAVNRGYGTAHGAPYKGIGVVWPAPFGGQGVGGTMDLVIPQSVVYLFAEVTYNWWPVQSKDVGYEIDGPFLQEGWDINDPRTWIERQAYFIRKYANRTDDQGVAWIKFQMPWPCENPEQLFGKYRVTATVDICGVVKTDVLWFDYYYLVEITKVTTDKYCYWHCEDVIVTVEFQSKARQLYPVLFSVVIQDELETHFGSALYTTSVSDAPFCTFKPYEFTVSIHIPKWAFAGVAKVYVSAYDKDPTIGGAPWCPSFTPEPKIGIMPYSY